jgi:hypothetical protein
MISVKIIKCSSSAYWYANKVGVIFSFKTYDENYLSGTFLFDKMFIINKGDFIIVDRREKIEKLIDKIKINIAITKNLYTNFQINRR